jgi:hypothetical protein
MTTVEKKKLSDFRPQEGNANAHTERGLQTLANAYGEVGYVAPMTAAANGEMLDGSARLEQALDQYPDEALVIKHDGSKPVVMVREDIEGADDPKAKRISYGANRIGEIDLAWVPAQVLDDLDAGVDLSGLFSDNELAEIEEDARLASELAGSLIGGISPPSNRDLGDKKKQIKPVLYVDEISIFETAIKAVGVKNRGQALVEICRYYLDKEGQLEF